MISWNKISLLGLLCLLSVSMNAQTYYYKLEKEKRGNTVNTNVKGGQFITFLDNCCYESDKNGNGVGHGQLIRDFKKSDVNKVYSGASYWGQADFVFNTGLTRLNVRDKNGNIYVYVKGTAPQNQKTCSLIRKNSGGTSSSIGQSYIPQVPISGGNVTTYPTNQGGSVIPSRQNSGHRCNLCNGTGRKVSMVHPGNASQTKWCGECGKTVGTGHFHTNCDLCGGDGWCD